MYKAEEEIFYVQDNRSFVGNSVLWWRHEGAGYTTNLDEAMIVNQDWTGRSTDIKHSKLKIDQLATRQVDMQKLRKI